MTQPVVPNQNLINPTRIPETGRAVGFWKAIALDVVSVGSALLLGYSYFEYLVGGFSPWLVAGALFLFSSFSVLQVFLAPRIPRRALVLLGETAALVVCFVAYDPWQVVLVTAAAVFGLLLLGYFDSRSTARNSMEVAFFRTSRSLLGKFATAVLLFMILVYAPQAEGQGVFIPQSSFKTLFDWSSGFLNNFYPGASFTGSFGALSESFARAELANNPSFDVLSPSAKNAAVEQAVTQIAGEVKKTTGVTPDPSEPTSDVIYRAIVATLNDWQNRLQERFLVAWAIVLFLALRTVGVVFVWVAQFVALVVYEGLLASGFMHISEMSQTKEVVEY
jgi:hypothetical protein